MDYETITKLVFDDIARYERTAKRKTIKYEVGDIVRIKRGRTIGLCGMKAGCNTRGVVTAVKEYNKFKQTMYYIDLFINEEDNYSLYYHLFDQDDITEYKGKSSDDDDICTEEINFLFECGG